MKKILLIIVMNLFFLTGFNAQAKENNMTDRQVLVAYFSATGTTKAVAEKLAQSINADLFEITPEQPYSAADLNWRNDKSRSSLEMADRASRPAIASKVEDMSKYRVVFVGFPIWWYREPSIIDTFTESYDLAGKTVVPFATSGTSGMGDSGKNIQELAPKAKVFDGKRFPADISADELKKWAEEWL